MRTLYFLLLFSLFSSGYSEAHQPKAKEHCAGLKHHLQVSFLDVGQGEAILIRCPDRLTYTLIDAGESSQRYPGAERLFLENLDKALTTQPKASFAYFIATHPDSDHVYGFINLFERYTSLRGSTYLDNGINHKHSPHATTARGLAVKKGAKYRNIFENPSPNLEICPQVKLNFLIPSIEDRRRLDCQSNYNDCSLVTQLVHNKISFLLLADAGYTWENTALSKLKWSSFLSSTVLKIGHHGSYSTSKAFLETVSPEFAVVSTGQPSKGNTGIYEFPQVEVLERIKDFFKGRFPQDDSREIEACDKGPGRCRWLTLDAPERLWSTAVEGNINMYSNGRELCISSAKRTFFRREAPKTPVSWGSDVK